MTDKDRRLRLSKYISKNEYIAFKRSGDTEWCYGIPISMGEELLLTLRFFDFQADGYEIVPLSQITAIRRSNSDAYFGRIVKREGAMSLVQAAPSVSLDRWHSVFEFLAQSQEIVVVDIGEEGCVNVGVITAFKNEGFDMRCFSPTGVWDKEDWSEFYQNVTGLEMRNHYTDIFTKYIRPLKREANR